MKTAPHVATELVDQYHVGHPGQVKVGGQALPNGVLMRTDRAWAIARDDGSVEAGNLRPAPLARVPVVRVVAALFPALLLGLSAMVVRRRSRRSAVLTVALLLGVTVAGFALPAGPDSFRAKAAIHLTVVAGALLVLRLVTPRALWRYHGAEHKAVAAHEAGVPVDDVAAVRAQPRVHNRCGTNLLVPVSVAGMVVLWLPQLVQLLLLPLLVGAVVELVTLAAARPAHLPARALLGGGRWLQARVTTAEPTEAEQAVACAALLACLTEHNRTLARRPVVLLAA